MNFTDLNLNKPLLNALDELGYIEPTPIQQAVFSKIMSGIDEVGIAQTGTGKTFAYLLPIIRLHKYLQRKNPRVLIVVPTRELVIQIVEEIKSLTQYINLDVVGVYGGTNIRTQKDLVYAPHDILVATPGRLMDLALSRALRLKDIKKFVIDEFDEMLNLGFRSQLINIIDMLPEKRQNLLFSATMSQEAENLVEEFFNAPQVIEIAAHGTPLELIVQKSYAVPNFNTKLNLLKMLLTDEAFEKVLIFVRSKKIADVLHHRMKEDYEEIVDVIHSNKSQNYRINAVKKFQEGSVKYLIATDLIARGVDISDITHVINYDLPEKPINYIHRIGRTGRADQTGTAISFIREEELEFKEAIEDLMNKEINESELPENLIVSEELIDAEKLGLAGDKSYYRFNSLKDSQGAYQDKKEKNKKVNLGSPFRNTTKRKRKLQKRSSTRKKRK